MTLPFLVKKSCKKLNHRNEGNEIKIARETAETMPLFVASCLEAGVFEWLEVGIPGGGCPM